MSNELITDPTKVSNEKYHTLTITEEDGGDYCVSASNNSTQVVVQVGSIAIGSPAVAGFKGGHATFDTGSPKIDLTYVDFDGYEYDEIQIEF